LDPPEGGRAEARFIVRAWADDDAVARARQLGGFADAAQCVGRSRATVAVIPRGADIDRSRDSAGRLEQRR